MAVINILQKIGLVALIACSMPIMALYVIMPRLAIATGDLNIQFRDISVVAFTNASGYPVTGYDVNGKDTATLDFWLEVGLPVKENDLHNATHDLRYYVDDNYTVNLANLEDPSQQVVIPIINVVAKFNDKVIGAGGSHRQYVLNKDHPVEFVHLYLTESRMPDGGLMYLFNALASSGVLDQVLFSSLLGTGGGVGFDALLSNLKLEITTYIGGAPLSLPLDLSAFGLSPFPVITPAAGSSLPSWISDVNNTVIYYNNSRQVDDFGRLMDQLGFGGSTDTFELLKSIMAMAGVGSTDGEILNAISFMFNQLFPPTPILYNATTQEKYWFDGANASECTVRSATEMVPLVHNEIAAFKAAGHDLGNTLNMTTVDGLIGNRTGLTNYLSGWASTHSEVAHMNSMILLNQSSWFSRLHVLAVNHLPISDMTTKFISLTDTSVAFNFYNAEKDANITVVVDSSITDLFGVLSTLGFGLADFFQGLNTDIPTLISALLLHGLKEGDVRLFNEPYAPENLELNTAGSYYAIAPEISGIQSLSFLLTTVIISFIIVFVVLAITKTRVKMNRADFLGRENVSGNVKQFVSKVEQLGGKVSVQNAESIVIRAFRTEGKIDKSTDVEKRAKTYVENQKLLVTLQSRASRAYVAQKFKDCISAIEKMIQIAKKLEDTTLVQNYEENLAKVVRLLRRKGISVSTKVRVEEGAKPGEEIEQLSIYKKELIDLQNRASKAFAEKNFSEAKESIKQMLAIAKKIQDPVLIRNYEANLRKIIAMEKGGSV